MPNQVSPVGGIPSALRSLAAAIGRYDANIGDREISYAAATEAAMWVVALDEEFERPARKGMDDGYGQRRTLDPAGKLVPLIRVMRNNMLHAISDPPTAGTGAFGPEFGREFDRVRLVWQEPRPCNKTDRELLPQCRAFLVGQEVHHALEQAVDWFIREHGRAKPDGQ